MPERGWLRPALAVVAAVTALRLLALGFNRTDLFVDEAQYWLWGQQLDWGYYSKPPLIAWVIRAVTDLAGSDAPFWVRSPGAVLHGVTALILGAVAAKSFGARAAVATAVSYVTLPMATVGSLLFSTDTVMLPLLAGALWFWGRLRAAGRLADAGAAGLCIGAAMLAKYAGVYALIGFVLAALLYPAWRVRPLAWVVTLAAAALVISPNILWNMANDMATFSHTADNAGWLRGGVTLQPLSLLRFWAEQFVVVGPVVAAGFLIRLAGPRDAEAGGLLAVALVPLAVVSVQAVLDGAYANWAVAGWLPGLVLAAAWLAVRPGMMRASLAVNGLVAVLLPMLTIFPQTAISDRPLLARYMGIADLSRSLLDLARAEGLPLVAARRDVLADLFYTGRDAGVAVYAAPFAGRPGHFYEQTYPMPADLTGPVLLVARDARGCAVSPLTVPHVGEGAYARAGLAVWRVDATCLRSAPIR